jgi:MFS family permease
LAISGLLLTGITPDTPVALLITAYATFGIGFGMVNVPITNTAVSGMPTAQAGVAAAIASTSRQVGAALGVAVIGSVVTAQVVGDLVTGFATASHVGWWIVFGCGVTVFVLGILTTSPWAKRTAGQFGRDGG